MLSDPKQAIVSKKQSVVFLQQLKNLFLNFNHEQKEFKADDIDYKKIVQP